MGGPWEVFRGKAASDNVQWDAIKSMPHCFNAYDAVDPGCGYYQDPDWYWTTPNTSADTTSERWVSPKPRAGANASSRENGYWEYSLAEEDREMPT